MSDGLRKALPWVALACGLLAIVGIVSLSFWRVELVTDTGETLASIEESLEPLTILQPTSIDDARLQHAIQEVADAPHLATLWLLEPHGEVVLSTGATAQSFAQGIAQHQSQMELQLVLLALPDDALSQEQQTLLHVASAIQREGEHNDIYRHIVRRIRAPDGSVVALIGITYQISPDEVGAGWKALILVSLVGLVGYWLALPLWTWLDARQRGERAWPWAIVVLLGNLMALLAYLLARVPRQPQTE